MTKFYSDIIDCIAFAAFILIMLIGSGTRHSSPSNYKSVTSVNSQVEIVELSMLPRVRDGLIGRDRR